jgi:hypothetical protein
MKRKRKKKESQLMLTLVVGNVTVQFPDPPPFRIICYGPACTGGNGKETAWTGKSKKQPS